MVKWWIRMRKLWIMASVFCIVLLSLIFFNNVIKKEEYKNVVGISIAFEENATENEVRSILDSYNLTLPYELDYNITNTRPIFYSTISVSYTHLRAHETRHDIVCRL